MAIPTDIAKKLVKHIRLDESVVQDIPPVNTQTSEEINPYTFSPDRYVITQTTYNVGSAFSTPNGLKSFSDYSVDSNIATLDIIKSAVNRTHEYLILPGSYIVIASTRETIQINFDSFRKHPTIPNTLEATSMYENTFGACNITYKSNATVVKGGITIQFTDRDYRSDLNYKLVLVTLYANETPKSYPNTDVQYLKENGNGVSNLNVLYDGLNKSYFLVANQDLQNAHNTTNLDAISQKYTDFTSYYLANRNNNLERRYVKYVTTHYGYVTRELTNNLQQNIDNANNAITDTTNRVDALEKIVNETPVDEYGLKYFDEAEENSLVHIVANPDNEYSFMIENINAAGDTISTAAHGCFIKLVFANEKERYGIIKYKPISENVYKAVYAYLEQDDSGKYSQGVTAVGNFDVTTLDSAKLIFSTFAGSAVNFNKSKIASKFAFGPLVLQSKMAQALDAIATNELFGEFN